MTLFTKDDCKRCQQLKSQYDLAAMEVAVEVLGNDDAAALAHLAWHGLVETARKTLPILVLDDSSSVDDFARIEDHLAARALKAGVESSPVASREVCQDGACRL